MTIKENVIIKNVDTTVYTFKDIIDLLIEDYELLLSFMFMSIEDINNTGDLDYLNNLLASFGLTIENKNLFLQANQLNSKFESSAYQSKLLLLNLESS
jgi:DNA-binding ferritin-like protein